MIELFRKIYFSTGERKKTLLNERLTFIIPESVIALIAGINSSYESFLEFNLSFILYEITNFLPRRGNFNRVFRLICEKLHFARTSERTGE